jgi:diaminopimelate epimerase
MYFTKMQGAGNDFVLIEANNMKRDWAKLAVAMCDRHFGIGSDGIILVLSSRKANFRMRMFNPDGSESEACGNGLRCLVRYIVDTGLADAKAKEITIETLGGVRKARLTRKGSKVTDVQVSMGKPAFALKDIPAQIKPGDTATTKSMVSHQTTIEGRQMSLHLVSMGNPHAVYFTPEPVANFPLCQLGPKIEHHPVFPTRTNFEVARVINRHQIEVAVWERGAGETLACGSGACAVAVAAQVLGYVDSKVDIMLAGGLLAVQWDGTNKVLLSGPAERVFTGEWPD